MKRTEAPSTWCIEKLVPGGDGLARLSDGSIGFAPGVLPGERLEVARASRKKGFSRALDFKVSTRSPLRVEPPCPYARTCGGCDFMHVESALQLELKAGFIREALQRTGGFKELPDITLHRSPQALGYRVRLRVHLEAPGRVGFFADGTHRLVPVERCLVAAPELDSAFGIFCRLVSENPILCEAFAEAELRVSPSQGGCILRLVPRSDGDVSDAAVLAQALSRLIEHFALDMPGQPGPEQTFSLGEWGELRVPAAAFVQVNWQMNQQLVAHVVAGAIERAATRFLDLFSGVGNFTVPLARAGLSGVAVEAHVPAAEAARRALTRGGSRAPVSVFSEPAEDYVRRAVASREAFDLVILDPPRAGARQVVEDLAGLAPAHIAYCACDPVTLARDLKVLSERGLSLDSIHAFDMFPQTHHVETLVWLKYSGS